jgi:S-adenosylmethionine decarboxylase
MAANPVDAAVGGTELLVDVWDSPAAILDDVAAIRSILEGAAKAAGGKIVQSYFHQFVPKGVTGYLLLAESHISIHTWPETGYAAVDIFACGHMDPRVAADTITKGLASGRWEVTCIVRGIVEGSPCREVHGGQRSSTGT